MKVWAIHIESMIVVVETKVYKAEFSCTCKISWLCEQVILWECGSGEMDSNFLVCKTLPSNNFFDRK